jgi:hypothetical protein
MSLLPFLHLSPFFDLGSRNEKYKSNRHSGHKIVPHVIGQDTIQSGKATKAVKVDKLLIRQTSL